MFLVRWRIIRPFLFFLFDYKNHLTLIAHFNGITTTRLVPIWIVWFHSLHFFFLLWMQVKVDHGGYGWQIVRFIHFICSFFHECCRVGRCKGFDFLLAMPSFFTWKDPLPEQEYHVHAFTAKLHLTCLELVSWSGVLWSVKEPHSILMF